MKLADGYELDPAVPLGDLRPHPKNPNQGDVGAIVESIETVGFYGTVTAQKPRNGRKHGRILAGEHRWRAAQAENADTIPVSWLDVDDETALRILLADNQIARLALLDQAAQAAALTALAGTEQGLTGTGSDADDLDNLLNELARSDRSRFPDHKDKSGDNDGPAVSAPGDIWQLGRHRLYCGDAFTPDTLAALTDNGEIRIGMVYTDPPYGMNLETDFSIIHDGTGATYRKVEGDDRPFDPSPLLEAVDCAEQFWWGADYYCQHLPVGGSWVVWDKRSRLTDDPEAEGGLVMDRVHGSQFELCWSKQNHRREIARFLWSGTLGVPEEDTGERVHPNQKPTRMIRWMLDRYSGDPVLDLFGGSGSTLIACEQTGRTCLTAELDPGYCDLIAKRWADYTHETPELNGTPRPIE